MSCPEQCCSCFTSTAGFDQLEMLTAPCGHIYCETCLSDMFDSAFRDISTFPPRCCGRIIPLDDSSNFLSATQIATYREREAASLTPPHQDAEEDQQVLALAEQHNWQRCWQCRRIVERTDGCRIISCLCGTTFCYKCGKEWHECTSLGLCEEEEEEDVEYEPSDDEGAAYERRRPETLAHPVPWGDGDDDDGEEEEREQPRRFVQIDGQMDPSLLWRRQGE